MTKVLVFGQLKIMRENPWAKVGMSSKTYYLADPQPWVIDKSKASPAQRKVWEEFARVARESITHFPADGSFTTLQKRVKWIGSQLRGKVFTTAEALRKRIPESAVESHPLKQKLAMLGGA